MVGEVLSVISTRPVDEFLIKICVDVIPLVGVEDT
jgi:hypothetical protein